MSNPTLLIQHKEVMAIDIIQEKAEILNNRQAPIEDSGISDFLTHYQLNFNFSDTINPEIAYKNANFIIVATLTDYDPKTTYFNIDSIESISLCQDSCHP